MADFSPEMRLFDAEGECLYLTADEQACFLVAATEGLALTPQRVLLTEQSIVFHTLRCRHGDENSC